MSWQGSGKREERGGDSARYRWIQITIFHVPFLISSFRFKNGASWREGKWFDLLHVTPVLGGMYMWRGYSRSGSPPPTPPSFSLCISYSYHHCAFVFCEAGIASDTLNQLPPPTPTIHPHTHMWASVKLMPLGYTRALSLRQPRSLIGAHCNSNGNIFR